MSETVIFVVGVVVFALTVYGAVMAGGLALTRIEIEQNPVQFAGGPDDGALPAFLKPDCAKVPFAIVVPSAGAADRCKQFGWANLQPQMVRRNTSRAQSKCTSYSPAAFALSVHAALSLADRQKPRFPYRSSNKSVSP